MKYLDEVKTFKVELPQELDMEELGKILSTIQSYTNRIVEILSDLYTTKNDVQKNLELAEKELDFQINSALLQEDVGSLKSAELRKAKSEELAKAAKDKVAEWQVKKIEVDTEINIVEVYYENLKQAASFVDKLIKIAYFVKQINLVS